MTGMVIQAVFATAAVVFLIIAMGRYAAKKQNGTSGIFDMMGYRALGPKKGIAAMRVGGDVLILGVTANDMRLLAKYSESELIRNAGAGQAAIATEQPASIADKVRRLRQMKETL